MNKNDIIKSNSAKAQSASFHTVPPMVFAISIVITLVNVEAGFNNLFRELNRVSYYHLNS